MRTRIRISAVILAATLSLLLVYLLWPRPKALYRMTILPSLGGRFMYAGAINDRGQIVGVSTDGGLNGRLFLWDRAGGMRDLGPAEAWLPRIDNGGRIAGTMRDANGLLRAFVCEPNGARTILGTSGGDAKAKGINNRGQVVGEFQTVAGVTHAFIWDKTHGMRDLSPGGTNETYAWAINDRGQILGMSRAKGRFLWDPNEGFLPAHPQKPYYGVAAIMNGQGRFILEPRASVHGSWLWIWDPSTGSMATLDVAAEHMNPIKLNEAGQVLLRSRFPLPKWWARIPFRRRSESYLWDLGRGLVSLDRHAPCRPGEDFVAIDLNNRGCIVGMLVPQAMNRPRGVVLLEPIQERWRR